MKTLFKSILGASAVILLFGFSFLIQQLYKINAEYFGLIPRDITKIHGIITHALLHGSMQHFYNNMLSLFWLFAFLISFYKQRSGIYFGILWLLTGILMFLFVRGNAAHIGASGIVYALNSFFIFNGIFHNNIQLRAFMLLVFIFQGSLVWGLFPLDPKVSWDGHMCGALAGLILSLVERKKIASLFPKYRPQYFEYAEQGDKEGDEYKQFGN